MDDKYHSSGANSCTKTQVCVCVCVCVRVCVRACVRVCVFVFVFRNTGAFTVFIPRAFCNVLQYVEPARINGTKPKPKKLEASDVDHPLWEASECV